ncbi:MAG: nucleotide sugar dehydrogenase, partial [Candidatus Aminicenantes bacterium]|nr:nucleotide sugar dehydrogenase [Candidatus Aminicenantes bacterium]
EINTNMPEFVISKLSDALNGKGKCLKDSKILILGIAYKKDIDDLRESPALEIIKLLREKESKVFYNDPFIPRIPKLRKYQLNLKSSALTPKLLRTMDAVVIITNHSSYDYEWIVKQANLVVDTRNATRNVKTQRHKIVKA